MRMICSHNRFIIQTYRILKQEDLQVDIPD